MGGRGGREGEREQYVRQRGEREKQRAERNDREMNNERGGRWRKGGRTWGLGGE